jgi:hypothetical protein
VRRLQRLELTGPGLSKDTLRCVLSLVGGGGGGGGVGGVGGASGEKGVTGTGGGC